MLSDQPHLLSSNSVSLDKHSKGLQKLLGYTEEQLARFVRKAPRCAAHGPTVHVYMCKLCPLVLEVDNNHWSGACSSLLAYCAAAGIPVL
jgi:hypothetical protein